MIKDVTELFFTLILGLPCVVRCKNFSRNFLRSSLSHQFKCLQKLEPLLNAPHPLGIGTYFHQYFYTETKAKKFFNIFKPSKCCLTRLCYCHLSEHLRFLGDLPWKLTGRGVFRKFIWKYPAVRYDVTDYLNVWAEVWAVSWGMCATSPRTISLPHLLSNLLNTLWNFVSIPNIFLTARKSRSSV